MTPLYRNYAEYESRDERVNDSRLSNFDLFFLLRKCYTQNAPMFRMIEFEAKTIFNVSKNVCCVLPKLFSIALFQTRKFHHTSKQRNKIENIFG